MVPVTEANDIEPHERAEIREILEEALEDRFPEEPRMFTKSVNGQWVIEVLPSGRGRGGGGKVVIDQKLMRAVDVLFYQ